QEVDLVKATLANLFNRSRRLPYVIVDARMGLQSPGANIEIPRRLEPIVDCVEIVADHPAFLFDGVEKDAMHHPVDLRAVVKGAGEFIVGQDADVARQKRKSFDPLRIAAPSLRPKGVEGDRLKSRGHETEAITSRQRQHSFGSGTAAQIVGGRQPKTKFSRPHGHSYAFIIRSLARFDRKLRAPI